MKTKKLNKLLKIAQDKGFEIKLIHELPESLGGTPAVALVRSRYVDVKKDTVKAGLKQIITNIDSDLCSDDTIMFLYSNLVEFSNNANSAGDVITKVAECDEVK